LSWLADNTLASATALNPIVGYDTAGEVVRHAKSNKVSLRDAARAIGLDDESIDNMLNARQIARGNQTE
jgi:fumarate hydratase class II